MVIACRALARRAARTGAIMEKIIGDPDSHERVADALDWIRTTAY